MSPCRAVAVSRGSTDDPDAAVVALLPEIFVQDGKRLGAVCSGKYQYLGERDVIPRIGRAIDAKRFIVARGGADHTETAVVVDEPCAQARSSKFSGKIGFFGCQ